MNRLLTRWHGNSRLDPKYSQAKYKWWHSITRWHVEACHFCHIVINSKEHRDTLKSKKNWAGGFGVQEEFIMCCDCYDSFNVRRK